MNRQDIAILGQFGLIALASFLFYKWQNNPFAGTWMFTTSLLIWAMWRG